MKIGDQVEIIRQELIATITDIQRGWYTLEIDGDYYGNYREVELKPVESAEKSPGD
jgi:hypothetical protein